MILTRRVISLALLGYLFLLSHAYAFTKPKTYYYYHPRAIGAKKILVPEKTMWNGYLSAKRFNQSQEDQAKLLDIKQVITQSIEQLPQNHINTLEKLEIFNKTHRSRGMANHYKIILNTGKIDTHDEMISVFTHEIGHIVDLGMLEGKTGHKTNFTDRKKPVLSDDPSVDFYQISWFSNNTKNHSTRRSDFVSGYAMSNPFEDFAESYLFYRYHGEKFRHLTQSSVQLQKKYDFMKTVVFQNQEFQTKQVVTHYTNNIWDVTLLPLSNQKQLTAQR